MVWSANTETATEAHDTVVIGDTSFDMEMARNAGAVAVGVTYGNHSEDRLRQSGAHVLIHSFSDLPAALAELSPRGLSLMKIGGSGDASTLRKFYKDATVAQHADRKVWEIQLDGRTLKTSAQRDLHLPTRSLGAGDRL